MWDDLFQAAAGDYDIVETTNAQTIETQTQTNPRKHQAETSSETRCHKRKKKTRYKVSHHNPSQELLERILESRIDPIDRQIWSKLPTWLSPGSSLCNSALCSGWEQEEGCLLNSNCKNCKRTVLFHSVVVSPSIARRRNGICKLLTAFALMRDIRCCCSCVLNEFYGLNDRYQASNSNLEDYIIAALNKSTELASLDFSSILIPGEADILIGKFNKVKSLATALREKLQYPHPGKRKNNRKFQPGGIFDEIVRLIICCDAVYFRMYYLQNSGNLPIEDEHVFLPHPPTYFGSKNVAWDVLDHTIDLVKMIRKNNTEINDARWDDLMNELGIAPSSRGLDSLSFMQKNRLSESILIFRKTSWILSKEAKDQYMESTKNKSNAQDPETLFYTTHETPAPAILRDWRDSCRDFLCNLYAYATISPRMIDEIKGILRQKNIVCKNVVEIGAGTGYIANLFCKAGLRVTAFDVAPTKIGDIPYGDDNTSNEYHGSSPPFCRVEYADSGNLQSIFGQRKAEETALLLCYPPPLSDMAEASLKSFVNRGGRIVIHIGEFSGLTGSSKFENFLSCQFDIKYRARCLNWGSDAAEITVWTKSKKLGKQCPRILVQCSRCKNLNAIWRLRMCRPLSYCTETCFDAHKVERGLHFAFNMIPDAMNANDLISFSGFDKEKYFVSLPCK
jgi:hypothetical protein